MISEVITCKGSYVLGTACGNCSRCKEEEQRLKDEGEWPPHVVTAESKILVDDKVWDEMQKELSLYTSIYLEINGYKITLQMVFSHKEMKASIYIYIDGILKGGEKKELQEMFWNEKKIATWSPKERKSLIKTFKSEKNVLEHFPNLYKTRSYYIPQFNSFLTLKNQYKKRHKEIFWIRK